MRVENYIVLIVFNRTINKIREYLLISSKKWSYLYIFRNYIKLYTIRTAYHFSINVMTVSWQLHQRELLLRNCWQIANYVAHMSSLNFRYISLLFLPLFFLLTERYRQFSLVFSTFRKDVYPRQENFSANEKRTAMLPAGN